MNNLPPPQLTDAKPTARKGQKGKGRNMNEKETGTSVHTTRHKTPAYRHKFIDHEKAKTVGQVRSLASMAWWKADKDEIDKLGEAFKSDIDEHALNAWDIQGKEPQSGEATRKDEIVSMYQRMQEYKDRPNPPFGEFYWTVTGLINHAMTVRGKVDIANLFLLPKDAADLSREIIYSGGVVLYGMKWRMFMLDALRNAWEANYGFWALGDNDDDADAQTVVTSFLEANRSSQ